MQDPLEQCRSNQMPLPFENPVAEEKPVEDTAPPSRPRNLEEAIKRGMVGCSC